MEKVKYCLLINSCDKYRDAWNPFFQLLYKYWPQCKCPIYLNTEKSFYSFPCLNIHVINSSKRHSNVSWSKRLIECLKKINTEYVIMMLEDFFLYDYVKEDEINKTIIWLDENTDISCFQFYPNKKQLLSVDDGLFYGYEKRDYNGRWWLRCQASIWRKKDLIKYLNPYESAWQFEEYGSEMAKLYHKRIYTLCNEELMPFSYNVDRVSGYGIYEGKWLLSNVKFFKKEKIKVNFDNLGFCENKEKNEFQCLPSKKTVREKALVLFYGTGLKPYMGLKEQLLLIKEPKKFLHSLVYKIVFIFTKYKGKNRIC